jgi:membrane protein
MGGRRERWEPGSSEAYAWAVTARILAAVDAWQRSHAAAAVPVAVLKKFGDDRASSLAALMAYYAFFSLFPLLLVFVSVLGFVLEEDPSLQADIVDSTLARIPVIGAQLDDEVAPLTGSALGLAVGLAGALWAGLGVMLALVRAFQELWDVPRLDQRGPIRSRAYGVAALVVLATALVGSTVLSGLAIGGGIGPAAARLGALSLALVVNAAVFLAVFGLLTQRPFRIRELLPGVTLAAAGSLILQSVGGWYVDRTVTGAGDTYGTFALVIGLLSWFWLGSHLLLLAAEVNVVLHRRLWPRSLTGDLKPADREALRRSAEAARQDRRQEILVRFDDS